MVWFTLSKKIIYDIIYSNIKKYISKWNWVKNLREFLSKNLNYFCMFYTYSDYSKQSMADINSNYQPF